MEFMFANPNQSQQGISLSEVCLHELTHALHFFQLLVQLHSLQTVHSSLLDYPVINCRLVA